jgi:5-methylthioadenosine/S-adenosylhomocysteine deaminase
VASDLTPAQFDGDRLLLLPETVLLPEGPAKDRGLLVEAGIFRRVGPASELQREHSDVRHVPLGKHVVMPGFVDTHHHLTQSFGKALSFGEPSEIFRRLWVPLERALDDESAYIAAKLSALESLRGGFTTVCEAGTRATIDLGAIAMATREVGLRCVLGHICNDRLPDGTVSEATQVRAAAERHLARWEHDPLLQPALAISIPEAATDATLQAMSRLAAEAGTVCQIHINEHLASVERSLESRGLRPLEHLHEVGALGPQILAAHATLVTPHELRLLEDTDTAVSYNPVASAWKGNGIAPAYAMAERGIRFGIGTDATRGDAFRLLDAAEFAQRLGYGLTMGDSSSGGGWTWWHHATAVGADAAGVGGVTGRIAEGKSADFLVVDCSVPEMQPVWDGLWEVVRLANKDQIEAVFVGGSMRLWRGWPLDWDAGALVNEAGKVAEQVVSTAAIRRVHPTAAEHRARRHRTNEGGM